MTLFPMFMKLEGRSCLVVGAGTIGEPKISSLIARALRSAWSRFTATAAVAEWARDGSDHLGSASLQYRGPRRRLSW